MTVNRGKKHRKFRGHRTHHGAHRNWRGGGNRGGRGNAGTHKHKWTYVVKHEKDWFGQHSTFRPPNSKKINSINLGQIEDMVDVFLAKKFADKEEGILKIDLQKAGYQKVLSRGKIKTPMTIHAKRFSKQAERKIQEAGGKAVKV